MTRDVETVQRVEVVVQFLAPNVVELVTFRNIKVCLSPTQIENLHLLQELFLVLFMQLATQA